MAVYAIGDIQGCYDDLMRLLAHIQFDPTIDRLWFVGDLVNRGYQSLEVLRFVRGLGDAAVTVLGNHDFHLLALAVGNPDFNDDRFLRPVLEAEDGEELIHWLQHRPLLYDDSHLGFMMVHAGLPPQWDKAQAQACAAEVEAILRSDDAKELLLHLYGNQPNLWRDELQGIERWRFIINALTRLRFVSRKKGKLKLKYKGSPSQGELKHIPWFLHPERKTRQQRIVFGHWSMLSYKAIANTWAIDTGCLWGGRLTALRLDAEPPQPIQILCPGQQDPLAFAN